MKLRKVPLSYIIDDNDEILEFIGISNSYIWVNILGYKKYEYNMSKILLSKLTGDLK